jgi:hypothetical protein
VLKYVIGFGLNAGKIEKKAPDTRKNDAFK